MIKFLDAFTEDARRFGLVLMGAGILTQIGAATRIMVIFSGLLLIITSYLILIAKGDKNERD